MFLNLQMYIRKRQLCFWKTLPTTVHATQRSVFSASPYVLMATCSGVIAMASMCCTRFHVKMLPTLPMLTCTPASLFSCMHVCLETPGSTQACGRVSLTCIRVWPCLYLTCLAILACSAATWWSDHRDATTCPACVGHTSATAAVQSTRTQSPQPTTNMAHPAAAVHCLRCLRREGRYTEQVR